MQEDIIIPKRFTATEKWKDNWFSELPLKWKVFWLYILDECDHAGFWEKNFRVASFFIGEEIKENEAKKMLSSRIIEINESKWFIPKFIKFQYGELSEACKPHQPVIKLLKKYNLLEDFTLKEGLVKGSLTLKDQDQDQDQDKEKRKEKFKEKVMNFNEYSSQMLNDFYDYWTEINEGGHKFRFELQKVFEISKRLATWKKNESKFGTKIVSGKKFEYQKQTEGKKFNVIGRDSQPT